MKPRPDAGFMDPNYPSEMGLHTGVDLNGPFGGDSDYGQPVHAITDGRVEAVLRNVPPMWGNIVVIWHPGPGIWARYAHLKDIYVRRCDVVQAGQVIGTVGKGYDNRLTAHLHLDILIRRPERWDDWPGHDRDRLLAHYTDPWAFLQRQALAGRMEWPERWRV
ncbi:M23 family metallopeptidase [Thermus tengchongensis]|uniref:M23 family metallopeptidase n=1 Tax=Thermus tengchongensis TaxID=1214928 RepID=UPI001F391382|nr:M23 family metallopeptidase [Thermus tengchongensis]